MALPKTEIEYQIFIETFEAAGFGKEEWRHNDHVAMAFWYLIHFDEKSAIQKIRDGIQNLNRHHAVPQTPSGGYHDTWTIFFSKILSKFIREDLDRSLPLIQKMDLAVSLLRDFRKITKRYYSTERIMSWEARTTWVEPDLLSLV